MFTSFEVKIPSSFDLQGDAINERSVPKTKIIFVEHFWKDILSFMKSEVTLGFGGIRLG
jgi:hypothetical protein